MKKIKIIFSLCLALSLAFTQMPVFAEEVEAIMDEEVNTTNYIKFSGVIQKIDKQDDTIILTAGEESNAENISLFFLTEDTLIFNAVGEPANKDSFYVGQTVDFYYDKNKPMILIYPAQIYPEIVIVPVEGAGSVKVGKFDEDFLSLDGKLKLNISDDTVLVNNLGKKITKEDLIGEELIVFYTFTTKSLPPQTTPEKIIAYSVEIDKLNEVKALIGEDYYMENGQKMIPLRKVAEYLGYDVEYVAKTHSAVLTLGENQFIIDLANKAYKANDYTGYFVETPFVKDGTTYVSEEFIFVLINE